MAVTMQFVAQLRYNSGLPEDVAENTFVMHTNLSPPVEDFIEYWATKISDFYCDVPTGESLALGEWMSPAIDRTNCDIACFNLDVSTGEREFLAVTPTMPFPTAVDDSESLPLEVALCSTYIGVPGELPIRRRRGRIYVGPLGSSVLNPSIYGRPTGTFINCLRKATTQLCDAADATYGRWCVWSRASEALTYIYSGYVDNEFDTQRRRQVRADSRDPWSTSVP